MASIIQLLKYPKIVILLLSLVVLYEIVTSLFYLIVYKDNKVLSKDVNDLCDLAKKNMFKYSLVFLLAILVTVFSSSSILYYFGYKDLDVLIDGKYTFYVEVRKETSYTTSTESALITKDSYCDEDSSSRCTTTFYLNRIYYSDGKYVTFEDNNELQVDKSIRIDDINGEGYSVKLLNKHSYVKGLNETEPKTFDIIFDIYLIGIELLCWFIPLYKISKNSKK